MALNSSDKPRIQGSQEKRLHRYVISSTEGSKQSDSPWRILRIETKGLCALEKPPGVGRASQRIARQFGGPPRSWRIWWGRWIFSFFKRASSVEGFNLVEREDHEPCGKIRQHLFKTETLFRGLFIGSTGHALHLASQCSYFIIQFFSNAKTRFQSPFMLTTVQPLFGASLRARSSFPRANARS